MGTADQYRFLSDIAFQKLRDAIIDSRLKPGQWLRQEALAKELGMSQLPVREALRRLSVEGLAERVPYRGVRVVEFTPADVVDMATVRLLLESRAVRFATPRITTDELARLKQVLLNTAAYDRADDKSRRRELNAEFHLGICQPSGRRYLFHQIESLWSWFPSVMLYEGVRSQKELPAERLARERKEHESILAAMERRDAAGAEAEIRRHIWRMSQELIQVLGVADELQEEWSRAAQPA